MGQSGREYVITHFDRADHANDFRDLIQQVAEK